MFRSVEGIVLRFREDVGSSIKGWTELERFPCRANRYTMIPL